MNDNYFRLPSGVLESLRVIEKQQRRWETALEPAKRQQAQLDAVMAPARAQIEYLNKITSATYGPILKMADDYQKTLDAITASIPSLNDESVKLVSDFSSAIHETVKCDSFPITPSNEWTEQEYSEFVNQELENAIGADVISDIHQGYQESPDDISDDSNPTDVVDNSIEHNDLRSDLTSKEWHARMWLEQSYGLIIQLIFGYAYDFISSEVFIDAISKLIKLLKNN